MAPNYVSLSVCPGINKNFIWLFKNFHIANTCLLKESMTSFPHTTSFCVRLMIIITVVIGIKFIIHVHANIMKYAACCDCARSILYIFRKLTPQTSKSCFQHSKCSFYFASLFTKPRLNLLWLSQCAPM